jgi:hypothetical protein
MLQLKSVLASVPFMKGDKCNSLHAALR